MDLGTHFIVGLSGVQLTPEERELWRAFRPVGCILFKRNVSTATHWRDELKSLLSELRELSGRDDFIVSIDHEGGRVHRLVEPITHFPAPVRWAERAEEVGAAMGRELKSLGVTLDFAPSFDVLVEPSNKVIGDRSFGSDPKIVAKGALSFLDGLESEGVMGCAKHFPGHGATVEDSHETLPVVSTSAATLQERELVPFRHYIESGRTLMMTGHVVVQSLDANGPATISKRILHGLLREELGFDGAIITDALDMGALNSIPPEEVAIRFLEATGDLFCVCQLKDGLPIHSAIRFRGAIEQRLAEDPSFETLLNESSGRIQRFLKRHRAINLRGGGVPDFTQHAALKAALSPQA